MGMWVKSDLTCFVCCWIRCFLGRQDLFLSFQPCLTKHLGKVTFWILFAPFHIKLAAFNLLIFNSNIWRYECCQFSFFLLSLKKKKKGIPSAYVTLQ